MNPSKHNNLVVFFIPPEKDVNGGILSIFSLARETRAILKDRGFTVYVCVFPGFNSYIQNDLFDNDEIITDFSSLSKAHKEPESLIIHMPEYAIEQILMGLEEYSLYLLNATRLHLNILNQNITLMPSPEVATKLYALSPFVTQSTAHNRYCTQELANKYAIPVHLMSVYLDESQYHKTDFEKKDRVILYSPDAHPQKKAILSKLENELKGFELREIKNLTYESYKDTVSRASFVITFGEGLDGYFAEPSYSGTVAFSVYNEDFFPGKEFLELQNVYTSYSELKRSIVSDIKRLYSKREYSGVAHATANLLNRYYRYENYVGNVEKFYNGVYTFKPNSESYQAMLSTAIKLRELEINKLLALTREDAVIINTLQSELTAVNDRLQGIINSTSWKATKPLRQIKNTLLSKPSDKAEG